MKYNRSRGVILWVSVILFLCWISAGFYFLKSSTPSPSTPSHPPTKVYPISWKIDQHVVTLNNRLIMPMVGFGTAGLRDRQTSIKVASASGYEMFDTASETGPWYKTEAIIKDLIIGGQDRESLFIVTKLHPQDHGKKASELSIKKSLQNLQTTYIDLYLIHYPECTPTMCQTPPEGTWEDSWLVMEEYYFRGYVRAIGVSNFHVSQLKRLLEIASVFPAVVQNWHDPFHQDEEMIELCRSHDIQFMSYSPLGSQWTYIMGTNIVLTSKVLLSIAQSINKSVSQVVLRWMLQNKIVVIPKSDDIVHINENIDLFGWSLSPEQMSTIDHLKDTQE